MTIKVYNLLTLAGYISLISIIFANPHPAAFLIPLGLFGLSMFMQYVEEKG